MSTQNQKSTEIVKKEENGLQVVDLSGGVELPLLRDAEPYPFDLMADYWTPENDGESKRVYFDKIALRQVADQNTGDIIELECAFFLEQQENGELKTVSNGSKRLVGALQAYDIQKGTPLLITYLGKKKNRTNSFKSDIWSVKPLKLKI